MTLWVDKYYYSHFRWKTGLWAFNWFLRGYPVIRLWSWNYNRSSFHSLLFLKLLYHTQHLGVSFHFIEIILAKFTNDVHVTESVGFVQSSSHFTFHQQSTVLTLSLWPWQIGETEMTVVSWWWGGEWILSWCLGGGNRGRVELGNERQLSLLLLASWVVSPMLQMSEHFTFCIPLPCCVKFLRALNDISSFCS